MLTRQKHCSSSTNKPYDIYRKLGLGSACYARAPARDAKKAVADVISRKHRR